jgi:hypothetical protein
MSKICVTKADGTKQPFQRYKIVNTCLRMHVSKKDAEAIADKVEKRLYDGIPTRRILEMVFDYLQRDRPPFKNRIDLRRAISLVRPRPDWERFVQMLLGELGYVVTPNQIVRGRCVEHEIDAVARKDDEIVLVEIKHHYKYHTPTGLDVCRQIRATFEDITEGFDMDLNSINVNKSMVVCNTKFSNHARRYAKCRGIDHIGWKAPPEQGLDQIINEKKFHPVTLIKNLDRTTKEKLGDKGIVLLRQLTEGNISELSKKTGVKSDTLDGLAQKAKEILSYSIT